MANAIPSRVTRIGTQTAVVAAGAVNGSALLLPSGIAGEFPVFVLTGTRTGGAATLDVKVQDSMDGVNFFDLPGVTFTQLAASGAEPKASTRMPLPYVRTVHTVTGAVSTWDFTVDADTRRNNP